MAKVQEYSFQAEMKQLLHLIVHSLYTQREIFLRELVSNASDALNKMRLISLTEKEYVDPDTELKIDIHVDEEKKSITISDTGIGMTQEELISSIGTIASSGTQKFLEEMKNKPEQNASDLIGQFGVGFYAVFMVTDEVVLRTRSYKKDSVGLEWRSSGAGSYTIEEINKDNRGTEITFTLKEDAHEFAQSYQIQSIIRRYSNFVDFPIYMNEEKINTVTALWRKADSEITEDELKEFYQFISNDFQEPLSHLHIRAEAPIAYSALLFVPQVASTTLFQRPDEFDLSLYIKRVFIQNDSKDLLPQYLRFVRGVVDTEDLPLNVSREITQSSPVMAKIKKALTNRLLKLFEEWAEKDQEKYKTFYGQFGNILKEGVHFDFDNKDRIVELLRFKSTKTKQDENTSLAQYVERMQKDQKEIYYLAGESLEALKRSPNLEYFRKNDIEVLLFDEAIDEFIIPNIGTYNELPLKSIEKADLEIADQKVVTPDDIDGSTKEGFLQKVRDTLQDKVKDVMESKRLVESPCTLVADSEGMTSQMERMMKIMDQSYQGSKKVFEINMKNPIVKNLVQKYQTNENDANLQEGILALYDAAQLIDGNLENPNEFVSRIHSYMEKALSSNKIIT